MNFLENILQAGRSVRSNMLRSVLTLLIIAFGIMALVGILTSIDSINNAMSANFTTMGANTFNIIRKGSGISSRGRGRRRNWGPVVTYPQAIEFKNRYDFGALVSVHLRGTSGGTVKFGKETTNPNVTIYGADENYLNASGYELAEGRNFTMLEAANGRNVAILGADVASTLGIRQKDLEEEAIITVGNIRYRIVGILNKKGSSGSFSGDKNVFIPLFNAKRFYGSQNTNYNISIISANALQTDMAVDEAIGTFRQIRNLRVTEEEDFEISKSDSLVKMLEENTATIRGATVIIGVITLLGAAIGLMNIMLVSVTERTREIGICKALGATRNNIMMQFLTEAIIICQLGGFLGILLGIMAGVGVSLSMGGGFFVPWRWIILGISVCFFVGSLSGLYPAMKAARMDPIESLRYE